MVNSRNLGLVVGFAIRQRIGVDRRSRPGDVALAQEGEELSVRRDDQLADDLAAGGFKLGL